MYQLIIVKPLTSSIWCPPNRRPGDVVWVRSMAAARGLLEGGFARWPDVGPQERPEIVPAETKGAAEVAPPEIRKSFAGRTAGRLTDSQSSSAHGQARLSSVSAAALVSPRRL